MMRRHFNLGVPLVTDVRFIGCQDIARLWGLRILIHLGGYRRFSRLVMDEAGALEALGLESTEQTPPVSELKKLLGAKLKEAEANTSRRLGPLGTNLKLLARTLELGKTDQLVLAFAVILQRLPWLQDVARTLGDLDTDAALLALAKILRLPESETRQSLARDSTLIASGLLRLPEDSGDLTEKLQLRNSLAKELVQPQHDAMTMLKPFFDCAAPTELTAEDYPHARAEWSLISEYLANVAKQRSRGVNILLYGEPGTGKTHFVRALAAHLGLKLCEVSSAGSDDERSDTSWRFGAYLLAQRVLVKSREHLILFDEIEDVFPTGFEWFGLKSRANSPYAKAWINRTLEENQVPTFWLSNQVKQIDPAYLRRFDVVVEMPKMTRTVRQKVLRRHLDGIPVSQTWLARMSEQAELMPAHIERAAKVIKTLTMPDACAAERRFEQILRGSLEAMGQRLQKVPSSTNALPYRLEYLNPDADLSRIRDGLKRSGQGRLCLYGPPGTGKSAYGKHVAEALDRPMLLRRASDLLSMWVGGTEKNIADMFREAEREGAVLLLDEADSFLQDRAGAQRSWEVTQVNELLTQMEAFEGIFIASTNLMDNLDAASLRRFDFKVRFNYLLPAQRTALFDDLLLVVGSAFDADPSAVRTRLNALDTLTPGDYAVAMRQARLFDSPPSPETLAAVLEAECIAKARGRAPFLGFTGRA